MVVVMVMVVVIVIMRVVVIMVVVIVVMVLRDQAAHAGAERIAQRAIGHVRPRRAGALAFDMVVVAFLHGADLGFKAQHLRAVFAQNASCGRHRAKGRMTAVGGADLVAVAIL